MTAWAIKYRPRTFEEVLGQGHIADVLQARLRKGSALEQSYLFAGPSGHGKTTLGRIFGRALICENLNPDTCEPCNQCDNCTAALADQPCALVEIDAATGGTIAAVRSLLENIQYPPLGAKKWVYLIDETHRLSKAGQDALLKPIEEGYLVCLFCTTEPNAVVPAIQGRCERHYLKKVSRPSLVDYLGGILTKEGVTYDPESVGLVVDHHHGQVRDILTSLYTVATVGGEVNSDLLQQVLRIGSSGVAFDLLLSLSDLPSLCRGIEKAVSHLTPEDLASLVGEAAMSAYKVGVGIPVGLGTEEKAKALQVFSAYQGALPRMAKELATAPISTVSDLEAVFLGFTAPQPVQVAIPVQVPSPQTQAIQAPVPAPASVPVQRSTVPDYDTYVPAKPAPAKIALAKPSVSRLESGGNGNQGTESKERDICYRGKSRAPLPPQSWLEAFKSATSSTTIRDFTLRFGLGGSEGVGSPRTDGES